MTASAHRHPPVGEPFLAVRLGNLDQAEARPAATSTTPSKSTNR